MDEPKLCCWCRSAKILCEQAANNRLAMVCQQCGARGPDVDESQGKAGAIAAWNNRTLYVTEEAYRKKLSPKKS